MVYYKITGGYEMQSFTIVTPKERMLRVNAISRKEADALGNDIDTLIDSISEYQEEVDG